MHLVLRPQAPVQTWQAQALNLTIDSSVLGSTTDHDGSLLSCLPRRQARRAAPCTNQRAHPQAGRSCQVLGSKSSLCPRLPVSDRLFFRWCFALLDSRATNPGSHCIQYLTHNIGSNCNDRMRASLLALLLIFSTSVLSWPFDRCSTAAQIWLKGLPPNVDQCFCFAGGLTGIANFGVCCQIEDMRTRKTMCNRRDIGDARPRARDKVATCIWLNVDKTQHSCERLSALPHVAAARPSSYIAGIVCRSWSTHAS